MCVCMCVCAQRTCQSDQFKMVKAADFKFERHVSRDSVAGVLLFYYIVRLVSWWRSVFIVVSVSSSCAMWVGLNWHRRLPSTVWRRCLASTQSASDCLSIRVRQRTRGWPEVSRFVCIVCEAEVVQSSFIRCFLRTILNRRVVSVLCAGTGYGGSSFCLFMRFEQSRKLST